jgi:hypothetical protein
MRTDKYLLSVSFPELFPELTSPHWVFRNTFTTTTAVQALPPDNVLVKVPNLILQT